MLTILSGINLTLPLQDPVLKFLTVLIIILIAPLLLNKIKVPHLLGLIIAGAVIGPNGFDILPRDSNIVVTGTTGLLYIMFLAGLEIDLAEFKKNSSKSLVFGMLTFLIPMGIGIFAGYYILNFSILTSVLLASMFASHTLISYPLISKLGAQKNTAVNITVGGTMITDTLALIVLAVIVGMTKGEVNAQFWIRLAVSIAIFGATVLILFPIIGRWFFKNVEDKISQFIFVLVMVFFGALLAEIAGIEAIIGAFLAGLALNRLIPHTSPLMNRVEFVGNAYFIPFFLISVGMLIDFQAFIKDFQTIKVAIVMSVVAILAKYLAAFFTQKIYGFTKPERGIIFGLSSAQAAATLAAVLVGYNIILSESESGEPVRLLSDSVLNGTILMILVTCTISSFVSQKSAEKIAAEEGNSSEETAAATDDERFLVAVNDQNITENLMGLAMAVKSKTNRNHFYALNVICEHNNESSEKNAEKNLELAEKMASSADIQLKPLKRYDNDVIAGINNEVKEHKITDLLLGVEPNKGISESFLDNIKEYVGNSGAGILVYHCLQPLSTIQNYIVVVPPDAHKEIGFPRALLKVWNLGRNTGTKVVFFTSGETMKFIEEVRQKYSLEAEFIIFEHWEDILIISRKLQDNDCLVFLMADENMTSYTKEMKNIPRYLNSYFKNHNYLLIYPSKNGENGSAQNPAKNLNNAEDYLEISNMITKIFK